MNWQDVKQFRKAGDLKEARDAALRILSADPGDFKTRSQLEWVIFDEIKQAVARIEAAGKAGQRVNGQDVNVVSSRWDEYQKSEPRVPEMACSMIIGQIAKVGHLLPRFADVIYWLRPDGLRAEDWLPNVFEGKAYPSLATKIALALCKWVKTHPDSATTDDTDMALDWIQRSRENAPGDFPLWLNWNAALLLRQMGEFQRAAELLATVIKAKRNEFWVWAEAGRLYLSEQPELALACFCRALECPAEPKFLVRAHRELAELLAEQEEFAQASREVAIAIDIRLAEGWPIGRDMEVLTAKPWYDAAADGSEDPKSFYARYSASALALCFDVVETSAANYLGLLIPHTPKQPRPGWKPKPLPRFVAKDAAGHAWSLIGPGMTKLRLNVGAPVSVVIGQMEGDERKTIVHVAPRPDGEHWDCLEQGAGVVVREACAEKTMKVFIAGAGDESGVDGAVQEPLHIGDGVRFGLARNPKNQRAEVFNVRRGALPDQDVRLIHGQLRRNPKGFGFVEDAFVPPPVVDSVESTVEAVVAVAVHGKRPNEEKRSWRVISLKPVE